MGGRAFITGKSLGKSSVIQTPYFPYIMQQVLTAFLGEELLYAYFGTKYIYDEVDYNEEANI